MHWVLQKNLFNEPGYERLVQCLRDKGVDYSVVSVIPFIHRLEPDINPDGPVYVCGATSLSRIAKQKKWIPGSFDNENFDFEIWRHPYTGFLLNEGADVISFSEVPPQREAFFSRPCLDMKAYAGTVFEWEEFEGWRAGVLAAADPLNPLQADTRVLISSPKKIEREYRFFIVDGRVVTGSQYRVNGRVLSSSEVPEEAFQFAQKMTDLWAPDRAFVLDVAYLEKSYRVIEINNINSAGFYEADVGALVDAVEAM